MAKSDGYILGRTAGEEARLRAQSRALEAPTAAVLAASGLRAGMRCLDAGCGAGDVMRLLGRVVGPEGHVTGVDLDAALGARMIEALRAEGGAAFEFHAGDLLAGGAIPGTPFDYVVARHFLIHQSDPVAAVRRLAGLARPGGRLVLMEFDLSRLAIRPQDATIERGFEIVAGTFSAAGKHADCGLHLGSYLLDAGLRHPDGGRIDPIHAPIAQIGGMLRGVLASLAPTAESLGVAAPGEIAAVQAAIEAAEARNRAFALGPLFASVWVTLG